MHLVRSVDWSFEEPPNGYGRHAQGLARSVLVGRATGAVHTELSVQRLQPSGWVDGHLHAFEKAIYVLAGAPVLAFNGRRLRLKAGDFALLPIGVPHSWANPDSDEARWITGQIIYADGGASLMNSEVPPEIQIG
jgi:quercetin dioxygenase-like cupin family protein